MILGTGDVRVAPPVLPAVKAAPPAVTSALVLPVIGPTGPAGPPGAPGGSAYIHNQTTPASTWVIDHDLSRKVHVTLFDVFNVVIYADIEHGTPDQTTVTFPDPMTGSAVLS